MGVNPSVCNSNLLSFCSLKALPELYSVTRAAGWLNASSRTEEVEPGRHCSISLTSQKGERRGFHLSARQGYETELLRGSQTPGATWSMTRGAVPLAKHAGQPFGIGSKGPSVVSWSVFRGHWRQSNSSGSYRVRFLSSTLSCTRALQESM